MLIFPVGGVMGHPDFSAEWGTRRYDNLAVMPRTNPRAPIRWRRDTALPQLLDGE